MGLTKSLQRMLCALALVVVGLVVPSGVNLAGSPAVASNQGVFGVVMSTGGAPVSATVGVFNSSWGYIKTVSTTSGGIYRVAGLAPGTYYLQATDKRPAWRVDKLAVTDARVTVAPSRFAQKTITMRRGTFVTGKVSVGPKKAAGKRAEVQVVSEFGRAFKTVADKKGQFALGGLPGGQRYYLWVWDAKKKWTGKGQQLGKLKWKKGPHLNIRLKTKAGAINGILILNTTGLPATGSIWATVRNEKTGQWWTARISNGDLSGFRGLHPGRYTLMLPQAGLVRAQNVSLGTVRSGRTSTVYRVVAADLPAKPKPKPTAKPTPSKSPTLNPTDTPTPSETPTMIPTVVVTTTAPPPTTGPTPSAPLTTTVVTP